MVPYIATPVLRFAAQAFEDRCGCIAWVIRRRSDSVLYPRRVAGMISPFAIRLCVDDPKTSGKASGEIYGISTLGSFIGTFLPVLVTIPTIGTRLTFLSFSLVLLLVALIGLGKYASRQLMLWHLWMPVLLIIIAILSNNQSLKNSTGQVYETESAYNYIQVQQINGYTLLRLNDGEGVHSIYNPNTLNYGGPWAQFLVAPFFNADYSPSQVHRIAIVGLAAGTTAWMASAVFGPIPIDGYELDPKIIEVGKKIFWRKSPELKCHHR